MPRDAANMPFDRSAPYRASLAPGMVPERPDQHVETTLRAESILLEEFNHASVAVYQAKEDSGNLFNLYLLGTAALATGMGVLASSFTRTNMEVLTLVQAVVFAIAGILSFAFFAKLLDLTVEYREGVLTMNTIKEFYIRRLRAQMPEIERAFRWRLRALPRGEPIGGNALVACTLALLSSLSIAAATGQARQVWAIAAHQILPVELEPVAGGVAIPFFWELLAGILALAIHALVYWLTRRRLAALMTTRPAESLGGSDTH